MLLKRRVHLSKLFVFLLLFSVILVAVNVLLLPKPLRYQTELLNDVKSHIEKQTWAVNFNILQYSSFLITNSSGFQRVESLFAFFSFDNEGELNEIDFTDRLQCVLRNKHTQRIKFFKSKRVIKLFARPMKITVKKVPWKIVCDIGHSASAWDVAIADTIDMKSKMLELNLTTDTLVDLMQYQETKGIDESKPKLKQVGHCLHALRELNVSKVQKLLQWLHIQKTIGFKKIRIYFYDDASQYAQLIYEKFSHDFVKIIQHESNFSVVCSGHMRYYLNNPSSALAKYLLTYCQSLFDKLFDFATDDINFVHGRSQTNDCYLQFKYNYEFTTNYDFDEILLPRKVNPYGSSIPDNYNTCDLVPYNYSIYDYAVELFGKYGGRHNVSSIEFDCLIYIPDNEFFDQLMRDISGLPRNLTNSTYLALKRNNTSDQIYYLMNETFYEHVDYLIKTKRTYDCLKYTYSKNLKTDFLEGILTSHKLFNWYHGKSIFNTDLTEYTTFHYGSPVDGEDIRIVQLPFELGFVSHYRDNIDKYYKNQPIPLKHLTFDIENYKFFIHLFHSDN